MNLFHESKKVLDKDGKVNALGPYGKQKLTGREVSAYFRRNKVKDAKIKKAVEVALDLGGAMNVASSEIKKFYGDNILKSKEVQNALKYANEDYIPEDAEARAKLSLKHAQDRKRLKDQQKTEKERLSMGEALTNMPEPVQNRISALRNKRMDVPHGSPEYVRIGKQIDQMMSKYAKKLNNEVEKVKENIKFNEFDTIRKMWEGSIEENSMERNIMKKMRKGKTPKGMPR